MWTADCIYIAREGENSIIDSIPLAEAEQITASDQVEKSTNKDMTVRTTSTPDKEKSFASRRVYPDLAPEDKNGSDQTRFKMPTFQNKQRSDSSNRNNSKNGNTAETSKDDKAVLQINTIHDGFNSGIIFFVVSLQTYFSPNHGGRTNLLFQNLFQRFLP